MQIVLQEQLRPTNWEELIMDAGEKELIKDLFSSDRAMSILLAGKAGTGKTSLAILAAKEYLGEHFDTKFKVFNASMEVNKAAVSGDISVFAGGEDESGLRNIIFFDEADGIGWQAQDSLRAVIEKYSYSCIFILGVNKIQRLHEALISRSTLFTFNRLNVKYQEAWLKKSAKICKMTLNAAVIPKIIKHYKGDLRNIVTDFLTKYYGRTVNSFNPDGNVAETIFNSASPVKTYLKMAEENYINPVNLLYDVWNLNDQKHSKTFSLALSRIMNARGNDLIIHVSMALSELK